MTRWPRKLFLSERENWSRLEAAPVLRSTSASRIYQETLAAFTVGREFGGLLLADI